MKNKLFIIVLFLTLIFTILPYIYATSTTGGGYVFGGFLLNPLDGNSYLAKMRLGWDGAWKFTLPYTANPREGGYLFLFYILLGHIARWLNLSLIFTFHLARAAASVFLTVSMYVFCLRTFPENRTWAERCFLWVCLGSGMGWLLFTFGIITTDLWVPEAYPFLSEYVNPHFPLGLSLLLWIFIWSGQNDTKSRIYIFLAAACLAVIQPFAIVICAAVLVVLTAWRWFEQKRLEGLNLFALLAGGGPFLAYQFWITTSDPVLAGWNSQNQTPSPALWDLILSFSPAILFAGLALFRFRSWRPNYYQKVAASWFVCCLVLILFPFSLQRRFLTGFYVPVVILAVIGVTLLVSSLKIQRRVFTLLFLLSVPTILVVLALAVFGISGHDKSLYLQVGEQKAFVWVSENTPLNSIILASPDTGNLIPAYTGRRVLYGHPFETVNAEIQKAQVTDLFNGSISTTAAIMILHELNIEYVFYGPRERLLGSPAFIQQLKPVFQGPEVVIYTVK